MKRIRDGESGALQGSLLQVTVVVTNFGNLGELYLPTYLPNYLYSGPVRLGEEASFWEEAPAVELRLGPWRTSTSQGLA
jgi:hypothetical protein